MRVSGELRDWLGRQRPPLHGGQTQDISDWETVTCSIGCPGDRLRHSLVWVAGEKASNSSCTVERNSAEVVGISSIGEREESRPVASCLLLPDVWVARS